MYILPRKAWELIYSSRQMILLQFAWLMDDVCFQGFGGVRAAGGLGWEVNGNTGIRMHIKFI